MSHVRDEDGGLDDLGELGASLLENGLGVLAGLLGLGGDGTLNELTLRGKRDLARAVDHVGGLDGLGLLKVNTLVA